MHVDLVNEGVINQGIRESACIIEFVDVSGFIAGGLDFFPRSTYTSVSDAAMTPYQYTASWQNVQKKAVSTNISGFLKIVVPKVSRVYFLRLVPSQV